MPTSTLPRRSSAADGCTELFLRDLSIRRIAVRRHSGTGRTAALAILILLPVAVLANRAAERRIWSESAPDYRARPEASWFPVHVAEAAALDERRIGRVGFPGSKPELLRRVPLRAPAMHPLAKLGGVLIVETVVSSTGSVAKARVLAGIETPELRENLVRCLQGWRFAPAMYQGEAWAVDWNLTFRFWPPGQELSD